MAPSSQPGRILDPIVEAYKKDVDVTLLDRNLRLTPTERIEQLQRFVEFVIEARNAGHRRASAQAAGHTGE